MKELKKPLSFDEQVAQLKSHNMIVENEYVAADVLSNINYYRFTGYALQQRITPNTSGYIEGTSFDSIHRIYLFDQSLRDIFRKYLEIVEVYYRTQISYYFSLEKCTSPPHTQHYDEDNFYNKRGYKEVIENFKREKKYYSDSLIMKHHQKNYDGKLPLWVIVEMLSFSNLSKLYSSMYLSEKKIIADATVTGHSTLENHLHCLSVLRNKCAHAARLYNTTFNPPAKFNSSFLRKHPEVRNNTVFAYVLILLKRLPNKTRKVSFVTAINSVIEEFQQDIDLSLIGFPGNYADILENSCKQ